MTVTSREAARVCAKHDITLLFEPFSTKFVLPALLAVMSR